MGGFERGLPGEPQSLELSRLLEALLRNKEIRKILSTRYRRTEDPRTGEVLYVLVPPSDKKS